ncbi:MAG: hypothetical protein PVS3B1_04590 [Ktedonobacteraceae bacterium]
MQRDSYFLPNATEEYSDIPQLAFPESQLPFPEPAQTDPKHAPRAAQQASTLVTTPEQARPVNATGEPQLDFPGQAAQKPPVTAHDRVQVPFQTPLPATETINIAQLSALRRMPPAELDETEEDIEEEEPAPGNQQAKRAIINGVISFVVSLFTLATVAGAAGLIIGTFAVIYGLVGLRHAQHLPDKTGKRQAIAGIVLGLLACVIVIGAFISRAPLSR